LRASEVDPIGRAYLTFLCRDLAKLDLIDKYVETHGLLREDGTPQPCMKLYTALSSSATRHLTRLEAHLRQTGHDPVEALNDYLVSRG
jgi:hypothetical protein